MKDKFSDDLHIYPNTEKRNLLNLHVLKSGPSILDFKGKYRLIHRTPYEIQVAGTQVAPSYFILVNISGLPLNKVYFV